MLHIFFYTLTERVVHPIALLARRFFALPPRITLKMKYIFLVTISFCFVTVVTAQDKTGGPVSSIDSIATDSTTIDNLNVLGLVWGFLKYYHPRVMKGEYHWDDELIKVIPQVLKARDTRQRNKVLMEWIAGLGNVEPGKQTDLPALDIPLHPDLDWLEHSGFSPELNVLLYKILNAKKPESSYYVQLAPFIGNPEFTHEDPYEKMTFPDAGYRLLALFRYWNMIQYYYPYKYLIGEDWKKVLPEFIPKFIGDRNELAYLTTTLELIARVHDTHANIWGANETLRQARGIYYAPLELKFIENKAVVTGFYGDTIGQRTGMKIGDVITSIRDVPVATIIQNKLSTTPASNYATQLRDIAYTLLRTNDSILPVTFTRNGEMFSKNLITFPPDKINLYNQNQKPDTCFKMITPQIAYLYPGSIRNAYLPALWKQIQHTDGLIIDLRCYPSEFIVFTLGAYLMPRSTNFVKFSNGSLDHPGLFMIGPVLQVGNTSPNYYKGKVVILVNETTQSQAEYTAMAFRVAPHAMVIGSTTAGADGNVSRIFFPGNIMTMISGIGVYYPDGSETQRVGIVPDIDCKPTIEGIKEGKDELLEKAIEVINQN